MNLYEAFIAIEVGKKIITDIATQMGLDNEDFDYYLDQVEMDNKGLGFNGKGK